MDRSIGTQENCFPSWKEDEADNNARLGIRSGGCKENGLVIRQHAVIPENVRKHCFPDTYAHPKNDIKRLSRPPLSAARLSNSRATQAGRRGRVAS